MNRPLRLLLVEDAPDDGELVLLALRRGGIDPVWARVETADELRVALVSDAWDAVLSDHSLPKFSATAALAIVRTFDPDLPFLVVSGTVGEEIAVGMMRVGAHDYFLKHSLTRLAPAVEREVGEAANRRAKREGESAIRQLAAIVSDSDFAITSQTLDGIIVSWNAGAERLYGYTDEEMIGRPVSIISPTDRTGESGLARERLERGEHISAFDTVRIHKNGQRLDVSLSFSPIRDVTGRICGVSGIATNIAERKRAEQALRDNEEQLRSFVENVSAPIAMLDRDMKYLHVSRRWLADYNLGDRDMCGLSHYDVFPDLPPEWKDIHRRCMAGAIDRCDKARFERADGTVQWIRWEVRPWMRSRDEIGGIMMYTEDITERIRSEEAIRHSEQRYRSLVDATAAIVWSSPPTGEFDTYQPGWSEFTGQTVEEHRGYGWLDVIHPDDREMSGREWAAAIKQRTMYQVEHRIRRADGQYREMTVRAVPIFEADGAIREFVGVHTDVTEQRRAEKSLLESQERLALATGSAGIGIWQWDVAANEVAWDDRMLDLYGVRHQNHLVDYATWRNGLHPDDRERAEAELAAALAGAKDFHTEFRIVWPDGDVRHIEAHALVQRSGGSAMYVTGVNWDITDRKRAEESAYFSQLRLQRVLVSSPAVLFTLAVHGNQIRGMNWISDNLGQMLGYRPDEALAPNWWLENIHPEERSMVGESTRRELFNEGHATHEYRFRHKEGRYLWTRGEIRIIRDAEGRPLEAVGSWSDITERKRLEHQFHQSQKMEAFGQLAGGVAHDFNNLLTIINGYSEILLEALPAHDPSLEMITQILQAGERSAALTRQLLAFSRQTMLAPRILDLNAVVSDTDKMLRRLIGEDIRLTTTLDSKLRAVRADPGQIEQVLMNLAVNARDAMPQGGRLTIETRNASLDVEYTQTHPDARPGEYVVVSVSDTGCGMPPEILGRIFEPFYTTKEVGKGTGLGLATVYGIIKQSNGHVAVYSEVGIGTTFKVYLPQVEKPEGDSILRAGNKAMPRGTETILLAEDEVAVRTLTRIILVGLGYKVIEAKDGVDATLLATVHTGPIHLLITDVVMPGAGGRLVAEEVVARHPEAKVLFISGYTDDAVIRHGVLGEGVNFLQKPFTQMSLAHKVRELLDAPK